MRFFGPYSLLLTFDFSPPASRSFASHPPRQPSRALRSQGQRHFPLLCKEGLGEVESVLLPHLASPYKGEEILQPLIPLASRHFLVTPNPSRLRLTIFNKPFLP